MLTVILSFFGTSIVGALGWAFHINSKVDVQKALQEQKHTDLKELINIRFDSSDKRLERIEKSLNGRLKDHV
jgi:Tfp pilus assembly protein PilO